MKCKRTVWETKLEKENILSPLLPWSSLLCMSHANPSLHPNPAPLFSQWVSLLLHSSSYTHYTSQTNHWTPDLESHHSTF